MAPQRHQEWKDLKEGPEEEEELALSPKPGDLDFRSTIHSHVIDELKGGIRCHNRSQNNDPDNKHILSPQDASLWSTKWAAKSAAQHHMFPKTTFRLLGTITRIVVCDNDCSYGPYARRTSKKKRSQKQKIRVDKKKIPKLTLPQAKAEAKREALALLHISTAASKETEKQLQSQAEQLNYRAQEIHQGWMGKHNEELLLNSGWDEQGNLDADAIQDDDEYVPLSQLKAWIKKNSVTETCSTTGKRLVEPTTVALYNGLRHVPSDLSSVLESLCELGHPVKGLYQVPLVLAYPVVQVITETSNGGNSSSCRTTTAGGRPPKKARTSEGFSRTYKICIAVYAHRLLPEVITARDLHVIMTALDGGSFQLTQPLHLPPTPQGPPTFASSPLPEVIFTRPDEEQDAQINSHERDGEVTPRNQLHDGVSMVDATICDSTREESQVSAYSVRGFLKLIENTGNNVSNWPEIEAIIGSTLKLSLMLHQKHAICWMVQMESLGGFGLNSILWEEREFWDGGKYYYSPALGQMRLSAPCRMHGGLLCDEMGLGKTIELLGLVTATLGELKKEADTAKENKDATTESTSSHATLIVVPPALVGQWLAEIDKAVGDELVVEFFDHKSCEFVPKGTKRGIPDIVVTTYTALERNAASRHLTCWSWGRVVLDEMQEVRSSTSKIAKMCDSLNCRRRWMLSGTPLFDGIGDLRGELNFLRLEPYSAQTEDGFFDFSITSHWKAHSIHAIETLRVLSLLMLRRSKNMSIVQSGNPLLGLKPLIVEYVPVSQESAERALYFFFESIVARELKSLDEKESRSGAARQLCLRLLRELCVSPMLLNGGLGISSQLGTLNQLMIKENRREIQRGPTGEEPTTARVMSCDEAIRYLSQAQEQVNVREDFVSHQQMGLGGGLSNHRSIAFNSIESQLEETQGFVRKSVINLKQARRKKSKSLWHMALEMVTTGRIEIDGSARARISPKFLKLWRWRFLVTSTTHKSRHKELPELFTRGWRPSKCFCDTLPEKHPNFSWAHPFSYQLDSIPVQVTVEDIQEALANLLPVASDCNMRKQDFIVKNVSTHDSDGWTGNVRFLDEDFFESVKKAASSTVGAALPSKESVPVIETRRKAAAEAFEEAAAQHKVYPTIASQQELSSAKKRLEKARGGLRIFYRKSENDCNVVLSESLRVRSLTPASCSTVFQDFSKSKPSCDEEIVRNKTLLRIKRKQLVRLELASKNRIDGRVETMSAFETLQALSSDMQEQTLCPICLGHLGNNDKDDNTHDSSMVAMIKCGHIFCLGCLEGYVESRHTDGVESPCPNCRKAFCIQNEVIRVDPAKTTDKEILVSKRNEAKRFVLEASRMLDESNGQLDAHMWEHLYHAIDVPPGTDTSRHYRFTAIPRDVLGHLRNATGLPVDLKPAEYPPGDKNRGLSTKIRALLSDLPQNERSVVFSDSKSSIKHLKCILEERKIGCCALFSGQKVEETEAAVNEWKSGQIDTSGREVIPYPVLLVQAGAAASGLTLTAACKMFLLEPFVRQEEEQQAFARCHRYGQKKEVMAKCYFCPVSVESRLLEWRKRAANDASIGVDTFAREETRVVYSELRDCDEAQELSEKPTDKMRQEDEEEMDRTSFLLGLTDNEALAMERTTESG